MEDNLKRIVSEATRLSREAGIQVTSAPTLMISSDNMFTHNCFCAMPLQIDPNVIAYVACLQEVEKSLDDLTGGVSMADGPYSPSLIASVAQQICKVLHQKDTPYIPTAKLQVGHE